MFLVTETGCVHNDVRVEAEEKVNYLNISIKIDRLIVNVI